MNNPEQPTTEPTPDDEPTKPNRPSRAAVRAAAEHRRSLVARLVLARIPYRRMQEALEGQGVMVSLSTLHNDVQVIRAGWRESAARSYNDFVDEEVALLGSIQAAVVPKALDGQLGAVDRVLHIAERRAKLLGLDRPTATKLELTGPGGGPIELAQGESNEERGRALRGQLLRLVEQVPEDEPDEPGESDIEVAEVVAE